VLHYYAPEVWLIDLDAGQVACSRRGGPHVVLAAGDVLTSEVLLEVVIHVESIFGVDPLTG
jgi:Uma2 family endonuclease